MSQAANTEMATSRFLNMGALSALRHLRFATRQRIDGTYNGRHRSSKQGGAGEFVDYREYVDGEDLRRLDWKVLARSGRAYVRLYVDETNLLCTLAIDASSSMLFNGRAQRGKTGDSAESKLEYAQYLATAMSHVIDAQQDQVGLAVLSGGLMDFIAPAGSPRHTGLLQQRIAGLTAQPHTDLALGLHTLLSRLTRRGVVVVMSDFLVDDLEKVFTSVRLMRHRQWEIVLIHVIHPQEERLPAAAAYRFEGMENEGALNCSPVEIAGEYERLFERHCATVRAMALSCGCDYRRVSTATPYLQTLRTFLVERTT